MLEFRTSARTAKQKKAREEQAIEFKLDDRTMKAYPPKETAFLVLAAAGTSDDTAAQAHSLLDFFKIVLAPEDYTYLLGRMKDSEDSFDTKSLLEMYQALIGEFAGRPTE